MIVVVQDDLLSFKPLIPTPEMARYQPRMFVVRCPVMCLQSFCLVALAVFVAVVSFRCAPVVGGFLLFAFAAGRCGTATRLRSLALHTSHRRRVRLELLAKVCAFVALLWFVVLFGLLSCAVTRSFSCLHLNTREIRGFVLFVVLCAGKGDKKKAESKAPTATESKTKTETKSEAKRAAAAGAGSSATTSATTAAAKPSTSGYDCVYLPCCFVVVVCCRCSLVRSFRVPRPGPGSYAAAMAKLEEDAKAQRVQNAFALNKAIEGIVCVCCSGLISVCLVDLNKLAKDERLKSIPLVAPPSAEMAKHYPTLQLHSQSASAPAVAQPASAAAAKSKAAKS